MPEAVLFISLFTLHIISIGASASQDCRADLLSLCKDRDSSQVCYVDMTFPELRTDAACEKAIDISPTSAVVLNGTLANEIATKFDIEGSTATFSEKVKLEDNSSLHIEDVHSLHLGHLKLGKGSKLSVRFSAQLLVWRVEVGAASEVYISTNAEVHDLHSGSAIVVGNDSKLRVDEDLQIKVGKVEIGSNSDIQLVSSHKRTLLKDNFRDIKDLQVQDNTSCNLNIERENMQEETCSLTKYQPTDQDCYCKYTGGRCCQKWDDICQTFKLSCDSEIRWTGSQDKDKGCKRPKPIGDVQTKRQGRICSAASKIEYKKLTFAFLTSLNIRGVHAKFAELILRSGSLLHIYGVIAAPSPAYTFASAGIVELDKKSRVKITGAVNSRADKLTLQEEVKLTVIGPNSTDVQAATLEIQDLELRKKADITVQLGAGVKVNMGKAIAAEDIKCKINATSNDHIKKASSGKQLYITADQSGECAYAEITTTTTTTTVATTTTTKAESSSEVQGQALLQGTGGTSERVPAPDTGKDQAAGLNVGFNLMLGLLLLYLCICVA